MNKSKKIILAFAMVLVMSPVATLQQNVISPIASAAQENIYPISGSDRAPHNIVGRIDYDSGISGTGFVIGHDTILTNKHVADHLINGNQGDFKLAKNNHNRRKNKLGEYTLVSAKVAPNQNDDVAIITVTPKQGSLPLDKVVTPAKIVNANYIDEQWMKTNENQMRIVGYPGNRDRNIMWGSSGKLLRYAFNSNRIYAADIASSSGASGSPLINNNNEVVGINSSSYGAPSNESGGFLFKDDLYDFIMNNK